MSDETGTLDESSLGDANSANGSETGQGANEQQSDAKVSAGFKDLIRLLFYTRYSLVFGGLLLVLAALPHLTDFPAVRSVYILDTWQRILTTTAISVLAAAMTVQTFRVTICNAKGRFEDLGVYRFWDKPPEWLWKLRSVSVWLIGLPLPITCVLITLTAYEHRWSDADQMTLLSCWLPVLGGMIVATTILCFLDIVNRWVLTPNLHDPRLFVLDHRFLLGRRDNPRRWKRNRHNEKAKACPLTASRKTRWKYSIAVMKFLRLTHGYLHTIEVWVAPEDDADEPHLEKWETLLPGHVMMSVMAAFLVIVYGISYGVVMMYDMIPDEGGMYGTLFYLVGLVMIVCGSLPALAFYFDRYRVSPVIVVLVFLFTVTTVFPKTAEHRFETNASPKHFAAVSDEQTQWQDDGTYLDRPISVRELVEGWEKRQVAIANRHGIPQNRVFVVVTATGGGIQASAWTSMVLTGIHRDRIIAKRPENMPNSITADAIAAQQLTGAIGMISCVSGGSVGTLQYVAKYPEVLQSELPDEQVAALDHIHALAGRSSLEAAAWGLFFPDAMRLIGINRSRTDDRGLVQEGLWASRMQAPMTPQEIGRHKYFPADTASLRALFDPEAETKNRAAIEAHAASITGRDDWRLGHLAFRVKEGTLPAVIFNSYLVNTGQRVMIAPFSFSPNDDRFRKRDTFDALEYASSMGMGLRLATAARLSATFPYVSPTAVSDMPLTDVERSGDELPRSEILLREAHYADGGYTDNEGLLGAIQLIETLRAEYDGDPNRPFDKIVLLRVLPFPLVKSASDVSLGKQTKLRRDPTWKQSFLGPMIAMFNGRSVAQQERGAMDLEELLHVETGGYNNAILKGQSSKAIEYQQLNGSHFIETPIQFEYINIGFRYEGDPDRSPPLSWKLSEAEKHDIDKAWRAWSDELVNDFSVESNLDYLYRVLRMAAR